MKSDEFTRSVRSAKNDRAPGDAPSMGRVTRMPGTGLPKGERRKRHRSEGGRGSRLREGRKNVIVTWSILLALGVSVVLGLTVWLWLIPQMNRKSEVSATPPVAELEKVVPVASKFPSPSEAEALGMVKAALAVREVGQVAAYFRLAETTATTPQAVVEFLASLERTDGAFVESQWLSSIDANDMALDGVMVTFRGTEKPRKRLALLTPDAAGKWKLDFDAFARTVSPPWPEIIAGKASAVSVVRTYVAKDSYYNGLFSDESQWICCCLASPDTEQILLGYCKIGSPQAAALSQLFLRDQSMLRATLEIRRVEGAEPRQFEISRVLAEDWAVGPVPFDERFR